MQEYIYTYQDWVNGTVTTEEAYQHFKAGLISDSDMILISKDQESAYLRRIKGTLNFLKEGHLAVCESSFVQEDAFNSYINEIQEDIGLMNEENEEIAYETFNTPEFGKLSRQEVEKYLNTDWENESVLAREVYESYNKTENFTQFDYIIKANLLLWLKWQLKQLTNSDYEPILNYVSRFSIIGENKKLKVEFIRKPKLFSYIWQNSPNQELPELYQILKGKLINDNTTLEQFEAVFTGQPITAITPVKWHDDNATELLYFIDQLEKSSNIDKKKRADYIRLSSCFVKPGGNPFEANFKSLKQRMDIDLSEAKQQAIKDIVNNFK